MEALTAASVAALTVYDMVKGVERGVEIRSIVLISKTGGKTGEWHRGGPPDGRRGAVPPSAGPPAAPQRRPGVRSAGRLPRRSPKA